jgi:hypothetical protein
MTKAVPWRFETGRVAKAKKLLRRPRLLILPHKSGRGSPEAMAFRNEPE